MEETYSDKAIILKRADYQEYDNLITVYTKNFGKIGLVTRGAKKIKSKMSGHIEVLNYVQIMIVCGRQINYLGGITSKNVFLEIKNDFDKLQIGIEAVRIFDKLVKEEQKDEDLFFLLKDFLQVLDNSKLTFLISNKIFLYFFIFKLLSLLGYKPEFYNCAECQNKIKENNNSFDFSKGVLICENCQKKYFTNSIKITSNEIKIFRFVLENDFLKIIKLKIKKKEENKIINLILKFLKWYN